MNASTVPYRVHIRRAEGSTKWQVKDTIDVKSVDRNTIPDALAQWISKHGVANGDALIIEIESAT